MALRCCLGERRALAYSPMQLCDARTAGSTATRREVIVGTMRGRVLRGAEANRWREGRSAAICRAFSAPYSFTDAPNRCTAPSVVNREYA